MTCVLCETRGTNTSLGDYLMNDPSAYSYNDPSSMGACVEFYYGQRTGRDDHLIGPGAYYFRRSHKTKPYRFVGVVRSVGIVRAGDPDNSVPALYRLELHERCPVLGRFGCVYAPGAVIPARLPENHPDIADNIRTWFKTAGPKRRALYTAGFDSRTLYNNMTGIFRLPRSRNDDKLLAAHSRRAKASPQAAPQAASPRSAPLDDEPVLMLVRTEQEVIDIKFAKADIIDLTGDDEDDRS